MGCHPRVCALGVGGVVLTFLAGSRLIGMVSVYSCFPIWSGEYRFFCHLGRFPVHINMYREDWGVFVFRGCLIERVGFQPAIYVLAKLLGSEVFVF